MVTGTRHDIVVKCVKPPYVSTHASKNTTPSYTINSQLHIIFWITISFTCIYLHVSPQLYQEHTTALSGAHHAHLHVHVHALTLSILIPSLFALCTWLCTLPTTIIIINLLQHTFIIHDQLHGYTCAPPPHTHTHSHTHTHTLPTRL